MNRAEGQECSSVSGAVGTGGGRGKVEQQGPLQVRSWRVCEQECGQRKWVESNKYEG